MLGPWAVTMIMILCSYYVIHPGMWQHPSTWTQPSHACDFNYGVVPTYTTLPALINKELLHLLMWDWHSNKGLCMTIKEGREEQIKQTLKELRQKCYLPRGRENIPPGQLHPLTAHQPLNGCRAVRDNFTMLHVENRSLSVLQWSGLKSNKCNLSELSLK